MTTEKFEEVRLTLLLYAANLGNEITNKARLGMNWKNDYFKLYNLERYIDLMLEFTPQTQADYDEENINFFDTDTMLLVQEKYNELLNTDFSINFILDE